MKVRDRIDVLVDLFLGALHADDRFTPGERSALERKLCELLLVSELPVGVSSRIEHFDPKPFDFAAAVQDFAADPPMNKRRLLELVAQLCLADDEWDLREDEYIRALAKGLGMEPAEYQDLVLDYEISALRESFELVRHTPLAPPPPPASAG